MSNVKRLVVALMALTLSQGGFTQDRPEENANRQTAWNKVMNLDRF